MILLLKDCWGRFASSVGIETLEKTVTCCNVVTMLGGNGVTGKSTNTKHTKVPLTATRSLCALRKEPTHGTLIYLADNFGYYKLWTTCFSKSSIWNKFILQVLILWNLACYYNLWKSNPMLLISSTNNSF